MTSNQVRLGMGGAVLAAALALSAAAQAIEVDVPTSVQGNKPSNADLWRQIKQGTAGKAAATNGDPVLIKPLPGCTDRAVGFTTPVNANVPVIGVPQGQPASMGAMGLLAVVFGLATGAGAMLARNLGKHSPEA